MTITIKEINLAEPTHIEAIAGLWTGACGPDLATSTRAVKYSLGGTSPDSNAHFGVFAWQQEEPVGVVLIETSGKAGWITLLAVLPETQRQGIGRLLLEWAEDVLRSRGCEVVALGGSVNSFVRGLPTELGTDPFFVQHGFEDAGRVWDVAVNLAAYQSPIGVDEVDCAVRSAQPSQLDGMRTFAQQEFAGADGQIFERFIADLHAADREERLSDYMILWTERGIAGLCRLNFEDSFRPIERVYPFQLPRPWGGIDQLCVAGGLTGGDLPGAAFEDALLDALLDAGLRRLHNNGANGCVIHAATDVDRFERFGFRPSREYMVYKKNLQ